jgi:hypothetical protein
MENILDSLVSLLPFAPILVIVLMALIFVPILRRQWRAARLLKRGEVGMARVVAVAQTGAMVNRVPEMRVVLDIERAGEMPRRVTITQLVDIGAMPRAGERVYVLIDPAHPDHVVISPSPSGAGIAIPDGTATLDQDLLRDLVALSPRLREHWRPGIATVISVSPTATSATRIVLDLDAIGAPRRRVTITQIVDGPVPLLGERVYVLVDPDDPALVALMPASMTGGLKLPAGANRLDPVVLGPQLLQQGAKATGAVLSAAPEPLVNAALEKKGFSKWRLALEVRPENGSPTYQAGLVVSLTSPEKAARIASAGAQVPLRYDPAEPQTVTIDSIAMGYGDPYEAVRKLWQSG